MSGSSANRINFRIAPYVMRLRLPWRKCRRTTADSAAARSQHDRNGGLLTHQKTKGLRPVDAETEQRYLRAMARILGLQLVILNAGSEHDFDKAFARLVELRAGGLLIGTDPFFLGQSARLAELEQRHAMPTLYIDREFTAAGGLISYGGDVAYSYRLAGIYTGRILKGDKPADLSVQQSTKVELHINLKTAKALGLTVPLPLLGRADEVIE